MSERVIVFSPRAKQRMEDLAEYLYQQSQSKHFVRSYLNQFHAWLEVVLGQFPESGTLMPEFGENIRRVVYREYSFLYTPKGDVIEILTLYRENLP
ncbi:type II toxin-antitoxin system RelE/ParE family toxin [Desulfurispirillum indicum]|uniref:type II toxin-antitoxin system RelE/ParE family toxin n=1 Tax=Desulfurispirillum indicum TaxID=936456 RepID=UPI001CFB9DB2|nr:type II toxin-antitoxin system RelE/ParE family toxin [Desulfurispirillum indicum]UCZ56637.1 type II toxin-antitoxin system RelE/ParE family toxin [Desulfurispirillum indicum]